MIDIHCHILPGIDDGAQTEAETIAMGKQAIKNGIHTVIATPHHKNRTFDNYKEEIVTQVKFLNELYKKSNIELIVLPGQEVRIYGELIEDIQNGDIQSLNDSKYLLIEFPSDQIPRYTEQLFFDIQREGIIPVIAHPERNRDIYTNPNRLYELVRLGALAQLTSGSLTGVFGKEIKEVSYQLLDSNLIHFIASDAHDTKIRKFTLNEAYNIVQERYGIGMRYSIEENAKYLIMNENINKLEPQRIQKRKKLFGLF